LTWWRRPANSYGTSAAQHIFRLQNVCKYVHDATGRSFRRSGSTHGWRREKAAAGEVSRRGASASLGLSVVSTAFACDRAKWFRATADRVRLGAGLFYDDAWPNPSPLAGGRSVAFTHLECRAFGRAKGSGAPRDRPPTRLAPTDIAIGLEPKSTQRGRLNSVSHRRPFFTESAT
jgi:hypothetical protein